MTTPLTKSDILADESLFQRACGAWVGRYIGECVSSLMYDVGRNLEECSRIFDFDYEEAMGWFQAQDWETAVDDFILRNADYDDLENIAGKVGWWDDICEEAGVPVSEWQYYRDKLEARIAELDDDIAASGEESEVDEELRDYLQAELDDIETFEAWVKLKDKDEDLRHAIIDKISSDDEYREIGNEYDLGTGYNEIYEYWTIPEGFTARELREHGQVVFDFGGLTIWGRMTTGQSISMDGVIRRIVKELDEDHWIWRDVR